MRELEGQLKTYAGQIQALALANQQLQQDNQRLRDCIECANPGVSHLHPSRWPGDE